MTRITKSSKPNKLHHITFAVMALIIVYFYLYFKGNTRGNEITFGELTAMWFSHGAIGMLIGAYLLITLFLMAYYESVYTDYITKHYPEIDKKLTYRGSIRYLGLLSWIETFKNSHPEDKEYTRIINKMRMSGILLIIFFVGLFIASR